MEYTRTKAGLKDQRCQVMNEESLMSEPVCLGNNRYKTALFETQLIHSTVY